jgi:hypothetical protein
MCPLRESGDLMRYGLHYGNVTAPHWTAKA